MTINMKLAKERGLSNERIRHIQNVQTQRDAIIYVMKVTSPDTYEEYEDFISFIKGEAELLARTDYRLQELWGFEQNSDWHKFWETPHCSCPKMDNLDRWGTGHAVVSMHCILHGYTRGG